MRMAPQLNNIGDTKKPVELIKYEKACHELAIAFLKKLYPDDPFHYRDWYWIADEIGGCLTWGDWYTDPSIMADFFRYGMTSNEFFNWYDDHYSVEKNRINIQTYMRRNSK